MNETDTAGSKLVTLEGTVGDDDLIDVKDFPEDDGVGLRDVTSKPY